MRAVCVMLIVAACGRSDRPPAAQERIARAATAADTNIFAADYIGPDACGDCHTAQHALWQTSLHGVMNQRATPAAIVGDFTQPVTYRGKAIEFAPGEIRLGKTRYALTRTIGKRGLQEYVGIVDGDARQREVRVPIGYWPALRGWYPQPYFDPWLAEDQFDAFVPPTEPWAERCPWCHSTYAAEQRIGRSTRHGTGHGNEQFFTLDVPDRPAITAQVTVGISCESCHLGGRAHAAGAAIHFVPIGATPLANAPQPTTFTEERRSAPLVNRVCTQCHSGPSPRFPDGSALRNSSEGLDLAASPCTTARCIDCHDPHTGGSDDGRANAACVRCHDRFAKPELAEVHRGEGHATTRCIDCHMPRTVMGIDHYVRSHRISSPGDRAMLAANAPNACNLCHLDRTVGWTLDALALQHGVKIDRAKLALEEPALPQYFASSEPAIRLIATDAVSRLPKLRAFALGALTPGLVDPLAHVRAWTQIAVERVLGRPLPPTDYDARAPRPVRLR